MDDDDIKLVDRALAVHITSMLGIMYAQNVLVRELMEQGVLDKERFVQTIRERRGELAKAQAGEAFDAPFMLMTKAALESGPDRLPADWLAQLVLPNRRGPNQARE